MARVQKNKKSNCKPQNNRNVKREQPKKDSREKRVNYDNMREDKIRDISETKASNDVRWYAHNPELLRSAASLPFSSVTGTSLPWTDTGATAPTLPSVPGVMSLQWIPSIGGIFLDAINQAKDSIYSFTVHANSRNTSYTAEDEMLVILAGANLFATLAAGIRAYGVMKTFDQQNKYLPEALVRAMGFSYSDLKQNLNNMWFDLNEMIARSSQIWIPNDLPFIERWFWMNTNIYMDGDSVKSQYYLFTPLQVLNYNEIDSDQGGFLEYVPFANTSTGLTWEAYLEIVNAQFQALLESEDRGVIFGDILKAYGTEHIYALSPISVEYTIAPVYDREVLTQIENATIYNTQADSIVQNPDQAKLSMRWKTKTGQAVYRQFLPSVKTLNFHQKETPTPEQIMVATRLMALGSQIVSGWSSGTETANSAVCPKTCGTEVLGAAVIFYYTWNSSGKMELDSQYFESYLIPIGSGWSPTQVKKLNMWSAFDWAPWVYTPYKTLGSSVNWPQTGTFDGVDAAFGDFDQWTDIDRKSVV